MKGVNRLVVMMLLGVPFGMLAAAEGEHTGAHIVEAEDINEAALQKSIAERQARTAAARLTEEQRAAAQQDIEEKKQQVEELQDNIQDLEDEAEIEEAKRLIALLEKDIALTSFDVADSFYADNPNSTVAAASRQEAAQDLFDVGAGSKYSDSVVSDTIKKLEENRKSLVTDVANLIQKDIGSAIQKDIGSAVSAVEADPKVVAAKNDAQQAANNLGLPVAVGDRQPTIAEAIKTDLSAKTPQQVDDNLEKIINSQFDLAAAYRAAIEKIQGMIDTAKSATTSQTETMQQAKRNFLKKAQDSATQAFNAAMVGVKYTVERLGTKSFKTATKEDQFTTAGTNNTSGARNDIKTAESAISSFVENYHQAQKTLNARTKDLYDGTAQDLLDRKNPAALKNDLAQRKADLVAAAGLNADGQKILQEAKNALQQKFDYLDGINRYRFKPDSFKDQKSHLEYTSLEMFGKKHGALKDFFGDLEPVPANVEKAYTANRDAAQQREYYVRKKSDGTLMDISELSDFKSTPAYLEKLAAYDTFAKDPKQIDKFNEFLREFSGNRQKIIRSEFDQMNIAFKNPVNLKTMVLYEQGQYPEITTEDFITNQNSLADTGMEITELENILDDMETFNKKTTEASSMIDSLRTWIDGRSWMSGVAKWAYGPTSYEDF